MPSSSQPALYQSLPGAIFDELCQLGREIAATTQGWLLSEAVLEPNADSSASHDRFMVLVSADLSVLLTGHPKTEGTSGDRVDDYWVSLSFDPDAIASFLDDLMPRLPDRATLRQAVSEHRQHLPPNHPSAQSEFTLKLLERVNVASHQQALTQAFGLSDSHGSTLLCQPVQQELDQQLEKGILLNQVITRIQESLDLPVILETTVAEVRQFLRADRLVIYQFETSNAIERFALNSFAKAEKEVLRPQGVGQAHHGGYIAYESRASDAIISVLNYAENYCFSEQPECRVRYQQGLPTVVDNIHQTYGHMPCLLSFLQHAQVKSKVVVPILVDDQLWGLLIAHQCDQVRPWAAWEVRFLQNMAEHLAIAIRQADLYHQLQCQKHNLEECVFDRTQELHDALAAAQSASHAKSEFLATMSHELRTPLTCIIGMSATLLRWSFGDLSPRQRDYLDTIHKSGAHLLEIINDILDFSRIESGRTVLEVAEFSLSSLAHQSVETFREQAVGSNIDLSIDLKVAEEHDQLTADPRRLRQILNNLLSNALKFTPDGGKVKLRVRIEQQMVVFQVEDTGIGIPESQQKLLFEKFQQLEASRQRQYSGTGLGLALTKQLVELHGGSISFTSKVGTGSIFTVRIPFQRHSLSAIPRFAIADTFPDPVLGRIVLVEDQEESASIICDMLTAADYQVIWVVDGSQVVDQVELLQPVAVIVNMQLAGANGFHIVESLRQYVATSGVKILALTAPNQSNAADLALTAGADVAIAKPIEPSLLMHKINDLMSAASYPSTP